MQQFGSEFFILKANTDAFLASSTPWEPGIAPPLGVCNEDGKGRTPGSNRHLLRCTFESKAGGALVLQRQPSPSDAPCYLSAAQ